jgi:hypothetical protein
MTFNAKDTTHADFLIFSLMSTAKPMNNHSQNVRMVRQLIRGAKICL